ncbi:MAG: ABC transporter substrate-binding protein [Comamonadaceae bacterium]|nr:ABC transporter substrate-binding protein [Comamonadaceae bacterium]
MARPSSPKGPNHGQARCLLAVRRLLPLPCGAGKRPTRWSSASPTTCSRSSATDKDIQAGNTKRRHRTGRAEGAAALRLRPHDRGWRSGATGAGDARAAAGALTAGVPARCWCAPTPTRSTSTATRRSTSSRSRMQPADTDVDRAHRGQAAGRAAGAASTTAWRRRPTAGRSTTWSVAGVSLVTNYRDAFTAEVRNGGIDGLIKTLQDQEQDRCEAQGRASGDAANDAARRATGRWSSRCR